MSSSDRSCSGTSGISGSCVLPSCSGIKDAMICGSAASLSIALDQKRHEIGDLDIFQCVTELNRA